MTKIKKHYYEIKTKKIKNKRIVLLSDIHYYDEQLLSTFDILLKEIKGLNPDYICIAGDLIDSSRIQEPDNLINWLENLGKITKIIISIGNHELLNRKTLKYEFDEKLFKKISKIPNVTIVDNNSINIDNICFIGFNLPADYFYKYDEPDSFFIEHINKTFSSLDNKLFNILLCHTPLAITKDEVIKEVKISKSLDLVLSGHNHGGITPEFLKPFLGNHGLYSPLRKIWFKNAYGHIKKDTTDIIISSGVTKLSHHNKFHFLHKLFSSEITIIDIKK